MGLVVAALSCGPGCGRRTQIAPPPAEPNERSALVAVHDGSEDFSLYATALTDPVQLLVQNADEVRFEWLYFSQTLEELALSPGLVPLPGPGESGRPIPTWSRAFATASTDETAEWTPVSAISGELKERRLPGEVCSGLDHANAHLVDIGVHEGGRLLAVIDANRLLVTAAPPIANYIVHRDGRVEAISLGAELDVKAPNRAAVEREGVLWIVYGAFLGVYRVSFGPSIVVESAPEFPGTPRSIAVELDANERPVVHVGSERSLYRLDGAGWTLLQTFGSPENNDLVLATNGSDHLVTSTETSSVSVHFTPSGRFEVRYPRARPTVLGFAEPFGLLMGTQESNLWRFSLESNEWSMSARFGRSDVSQIVAHRRGFVVGFTETPELAEYHAERGFCDLTRTSLSDTRFLVSWGDEVAALPRRSSPTAGLQLLRIPARP